MSTDYGQTLAAFVLDSGKQSRRLLKRIQEIDDVDPNVKIVDAAIADRTRFRVKVHQTADLGGAKGTVRGAGLGVIVGAIVLGPAGAVVGGAAGGVLNGLRNRFHDIGINDKFMRQVTKELDQGQERHLHPVRGELVRFDRDDPAGRRGREGPPDPRHAARREGRRAQGARRSGSGAAGGHEVVEDYEVEVPEEAPRPPAAAAAAAAAGRGAPHRPPRSPTT